MCSAEKLLGVLEQNLPEGISLYPFVMDELEISESVRLKCQIPLCKNYGMRKVCPPNLPSIPTIREAFKNCQQGYIVVQRVLVDDLGGKEESNIEKLETKMVDTITDLERILIGEGYYKVYGLGPGGCHLCETCTPSGEPCRHPYKARPCLSAMGIDITALAKKKGIPMEWPPKDEVLIMGMLLI